ncbi:MAG: recombinase zinc beta ribbon domain-containing protein [Butyricicoccus sp.]
MSKNSTLWKYFAIADMWKMKLYRQVVWYGSVSYKTKQCKPRPKDQYVVRGTHEPIIDQELWDKVCRRRAERSRPFSDGKIGIFARKARCAYCGYTLRSSKTQDRHYLQCPNRHISVEACPGAFIAVSHLEEAVLEELNRMAQEFLDKDEAADSVAFCKDLQKQKKCLQKEINTYRQKQEEYTTGIRNLYLDKVKGLLTEQDYLAMSKDFAGERDRLEHVIEDGEKQMRELEERIAIGDNRRALVEKYMNIEHLNREMVDTLIDYVVVGRRAKGTKTVPVEIHWNF